MTKIPSHLLDQSTELSFPLRLFRFVLHRYGIFGATIIGTLISVLVSVLMTALITFIVYGVVFGLKIGAFIGAIIGFIFFLIMMLALRDLERMRQQLEHLARIDGLTQAFNRRYFIDMLTYELEKSMRYDTPLSLILFDIDNFKTVNDVYGHNAGDSVLQAVSDLCRSETRQPDIFARIGGEEFACLLSGSSAQHYAVLAERLRELIQNLVIEYEQQHIHVTISVGVASYHKGITLPEHLLKHADIALYAAKNNGKNRVERHGIQVNNANYVSPIN